VTEPLVIQFAETGDAPDIARIHVESWQIGYRGILDETFLASLSVERREVMWRESIEKSSPPVLVAKRGGVMLGWLAVGRSRDVQASAGSAEIWAFYVAPDHWSNGVGQALWAKAMEHLEKSHFQHVSLWVIAPNARARRFYEAVGLTLDAPSQRTVEVGGRPLAEIRYTRELS
jgi:ribosomal protein S18 acetylase RimI-like enzyme